ncbi:MAG: hypothetical protein VB070_04625 [Clostridiaceae bacterium]|nr:hypothetical protein [Clostridiaceae bacterium]
MLKCGLYELDITPALGCEIPGYFGVRLADGIKENLYTHAAYFEDDNGKKIVIISSDGIQIPDSVNEKVRPAVAKALEMDISGVLTCATHIHTGGPLLDWDDFSHTDAVYLEFLASRMVDVAVLAQGKKTDVKIGYAKGYDDTLAHYRDFVMGDGTYRTNPPVGGDKHAFGNIDPEISVLRIDKASGERYGAMIGYACHTDCVGGTQYSSDFPGAMKETLRKLYGNDFMPIFVNGFFGNINHIDFENGTHRVPGYYQSMGRRLAAEAARVMESVTLTSVIGLDMISGTIAIPTREPDADLLAWADQIYENYSQASVDDRHYASEARRIKELGVRNIDLVMQVLKLGDLLIFASPKEMYVEFQLMLKAKSPSRQTMCIGLANGPCGYVPIRELFQPGIYEARLNGSQLTMDAGYRMVDKLLELAGKI